MKYVPCSGLAGENLIEPSSIGGLSKWYSGPTLLQVIGKFTVHTYVMASVPTFMEKM